MVVPRSGLTYPDLPRTAWYYKGCLSNTSLPVHNGDHLQITLLHHFLQVHPSHSCMNLDMVITSMVPSIDPSYITLVLSDHVAKTSWVAVPIALTG